MTPFLFKRTIFRTLSFFVITFMGAPVFAVDVGSTAIEVSTQAPASSLSRAIENTIAKKQKAVLTDNAVTQFVAGDFTQREQLLNHWPGSAQDFKKMADAIEASQLYTDGQNAYLVDKDIVKEFITGATTHKKSSELNQIILNNTLRSLLAANQAKVLLQSDSAAMRREAVKTLSKDISSVDPTLIEGAYSREKVPDVKKELGILKGQLDLNSADLSRQIAGAHLLSASDSPEVLARIDSFLEKPVLDPVLKKTLAESRSEIKGRLQLSEAGSYLFSGVSLASILLLAALGLAITYGLLGVINMAHGELIMIGAYTTYVVQGLFQKYLPSMLDSYLLFSIPAAFVVAGLVGMLIERIVIRPLYGRQLETLLATFGVSLILMQVIRMLFGAQNVQVTNPSWMSGAVHLTSTLTLPYSRIAIVGFTIAVLALVKWFISYTRFGLFVRAVTQNRQMARAIGVRSSKVDMLAFGLGSGLAGLAGAALSQIGNVGPDLGQNYIIDTFLVVVVGGVGQLLGAVLAAFGLGIGGKLLEIGMGPVLAKIALLALIILFIQKRPQGLFAVKGRFVE